MIYHSSFDMEYLGWCMIMGGVWMMGESKLRQILVPNASALGSLCFVMILLCPIPILLYADSIQKQLHRRLYTILGGLALLDFAVCSILTFFGIADYIETLPIGQIIPLFDTCRCIYPFVYLYAQQPPQIRPASSSGSVGSHHMYLYRSDFCLILLPAYPDCSSALA